MKQNVMTHLQYVTQGQTLEEHLAHVAAACQAGCRWIQLRMKHHTDAHYKEAAQAALKICNSYDAQLIINDHVMVARAVGCHGVHLGKEDMDVGYARVLLGDHYIIGGTANTWADVQRLAAAGVDYVGVGPYRFTTTKEKLSPILGLAGYEQLLGQCRAAGLSCPIVAIGGITLADVPALQKAGVAGVAISGALTHASDKAHFVKAVADVFKPPVSQLVTAGTMNKERLKS